MTKRKLDENECYETKFFTLDVNNRNKSRTIKKQTYHGRIGGRECVHRFTEGKALPWCRSGRKRTQKPLVIERTKDEVNCKLCISDSRYAYT